MTRTSVRDFFLKPGEYDTTVNADVYEAYVDFDEEQAPVTRPEAPWVNKRPPSPFDDLSKIRLPVDADGDGWVFDNIPGKKRLAARKLPGNKAKPVGPKKIKLIKPPMTAFERANVRAGLNPKGTGFAPKKKVKPKQVKRIEPINGKKPTPAPLRQEAIRGDGGPGNRGMRIPIRPSNELHPPEAKKPDPKAVEAARKKKALAVARGLETEARNKIWAIEDEYGSSNIPETSGLYAKRKAWEARLKVRAQAVRDLEQGKEPAAKPVKPVKPKKPLPLIPSGVTPSTPAPATPNKPTPAAPGKPKVPEAPSEPGGDSPARAPQGDLPEAWHLKSGYVGARLTVTDPQGKEMIVNVIGMNGDDIRSEIQIMKDGGFKISAIEAPTKDIGETKAEDELEHEAIAPAAKAKIAELADIGRNAPQTDADGNKINPAGDRQQEGYPKEPADIGEEEPPAKAPVKPDAAEQAAAEGEASSGYNGPKTPGTEHFAKGGGIHDFPEGEDIMAAIEAFPNRFKPQGRNHDGGSSPLVYTDEEDDTGIEVSLDKHDKRRTTKRVFFIKPSVFFDADDEASNEILANEFLKQMGFKLNTITRVKVGSETRILQDHVGQYQDKDAKILRGMEDRPGWVPGKNLDNKEIGDFRNALFSGNKFYAEPYGKWADQIEQGDDPGNFLRLALMDYIMLNQDRHTGNFMQSDGPGGLTALPIDHGYAFGAGMRLTEPNSPPIVTMDDWIDVRRVGGLNNAAAFLGIGVEVLQGGNEQSVRDEIAKVIEMLESFDGRKLRQTLDKRNVSTQQKTKMEADIKDMEVRIKWMKTHTDDIMETLMARPANG